MRIIEIQITLVCLMMTVLGSAGCQAGDYLTREDCDLDGDGYLAQTPECGGNDCDDHNQLINPDPNTLEKCQDNIDNNCDGHINEDCICNNSVDRIRECAIDDDGNQIHWETGTPKMPCRNGTQMCMPDGTWSKCSGAMLPREEICDGIDNDCNGKIDNGQFYQGGTQQVGDKCRVGLGACMVSGTVLCQSFSTSHCVGTVPPAPLPIEPRFMPAPNGDWDWSCDGDVTQKCCLDDPLSPLSCVDVAAGECPRTFSRSSDDSTFCTENCAHFLKNCRDIAVQTWIYIAPAAPLKCGDKNIKICPCTRAGSGDSAICNTVSAAFIQKGKVGCY